MARSNEPFWWSLFSAGGTVAAFLLPITICVTGVAVPAGWISAESLRALVLSWPGRLFLFLMISLPLFHWAHRFRYAAEDLGLRGLGRGLPVLCYGGAVVGTILAVIFLVRM